VIILTLSFTLIFTLDLKSYIVPLMLGWTISFWNVIIGGWIITKEFKKQGTGFINKVLLSLVVRVFVIVATLFTLIYFFKVEKISLAVILFFFYIIFLIVEINYLSENTNKN
jgi:hypothetical protein